MKLSRSSFVLGAQGGAPAWDDTDWNETAYLLPGVIKLATKIQVQWALEGNDVSVVFDTGDEILMYQNTFRGTGPEMRPFIRLMNMFVEARTICKPNESAEETFISVCLTAVTQATGRRWGSMRAVRWEDVKSSVQTILSGEQEWSAS